ncbi:uncharacterized protein BP5553_06773 [Venustampulla echinocandica]|uniref:Uncharacterized protein n=1 Tax=Venustampulla echinocandica TaxID=2656787 RepID=A0A370TKV5_9HELO|nr:uncharacterized protein BP5553_06773 [Venustampulla echinocandica]RDL36161.1 hypothetical protein BP5553_06773 [Venustampulla echinocandica]
MAPPVPPKRNPYVDGYPRTPPLVYLPFRLEHTLMTCIQKLLEETCFHFAEKWIPDLLRKQGWDTPEAGELNHWWGALKHSQVPRHAVNFQSSDEVEYLIVRLHQVRHAAVHRLRSDEIIKRMLKDAVDFVSGFGDELRRDKLRDIEVAVLTQDHNLIDRAIAKPLQDFQPLGFGNRPVANDPQQGIVPRAEYRQPPDDQPRFQSTAAPTVPIFRHAAPQKPYANWDSIYSRQAVDRQALNQQTLNQQALNQQALTLNQQALNQQTLNQQTLNQQTLNQRGLDQRLWNQQVLNRQVLDRRAVEREAFFQQALNQVAFNQQALNQEPVKQEQAREQTDSQQLATHPEIHSKGSLEAVTNNKRRLTEPMDIIDLTIESGPEDENQRPTKRIKKEIIDLTDSADEADV